jgi:dCTP deaminase
MKDMILTRAAIKNGVGDRSIIIEPFHESDLNPNSYNYRLGPNLVLINNEGLESRTEIPGNGLILHPQNLYLGCTAERIGSNTYVMQLMGRSSMGRLGIFLNITADLGHVGSDLNWTLEIKVVQPVRVYPGQRIGQVVFWALGGVPTMMYQGRYLRDQLPSPSRDQSLTTKNQ